MWRNGRRNGLKIRSRESEVWVRIPSSAPSKMRFYERKSANWPINPVAKGRAPKRTNSPSIRQVFVNYWQRAPNALIEKPVGIPSYAFFWFTCTIARPPLSTARLRADVLSGDSFIPRFRLMIVSCRSSVAAVRFSALESTASLSSHNFSIRSRPRLAIRTALTMCSVFSRSIHGRKSSTICLATN